MSLQGLSLSGVEATHVKEEIIEKMKTRYSHVTKMTIPVNDSCGAVFTTNRDEIMEKKQHPLLYEIHHFFHHNDHCDLI